MTTRERRLGALGPTSRSEAGAFGRGVIVGHHPGTHELWRVELVPSQSKSGSVSVCAGAPRVRARSYFLTSREVERGLLQLGAA